MTDTTGTAPLSRFEHIVKQVPIGITILKGEDMVVEMANETYLQIIDRPEEDVLGRSLYSVLPEVATSVKPLLDKVFKTGIPYNGFEFPVMLNRYGQSELTYFNFTYQPSKNDDNEIDGVIVVANEVTNLVKTRQSIEESERQFRNLVMDSPIAMTIFRGPEFIIERANHTMFNNIWRRKEEEVVGKSIVEAFPELKNQKYPDLLKAVYEQGHIHRENESMAIVGEELFYLDFEYAPLREPTGEVSGIMVTVYDVTEKVIARQTLEEAKERLQLAVEATGLANWDLDLRTNKVIHAPRMAEIFGHAPGTVLTQGELHAQVLPEDLERVLFKARRIAVETGVYKYEARIRLPDGNIAWIKTQGKVIFDEEGNPLKMIGTLRDITEEKAFEQELERQVQERTRELAVKNEALEKMNAELKSFAYVSGHDLQEPLRKIRIFSERIAELEADNLSERGKDYFGRIEKAASTMQTLIKDLLAYTRAGSSERVFEQRSMDELLADVTNQLKEEIEETGAEIISDKLGEAHIIPFQFVQLLLNLIGNSLKFTRPGVTPVITVRHLLVSGADVPQDHAVVDLQYHHLRVSDNGIGFDNEFRERIFDIFQRLNAKDKFKGTGIGLAIVKKIVENHNGFITASGERDKGATFDIYLPV